MRLSVSILLALSVVAGASAQDLSSASSSCFSNQRTLARAVGRYNHDLNLNVAEIPWDELIEEGYLRSLLLDPEQGPSTHTNYQLTSDAPLGVTCVNHGAAPAPAFPARRNRRRCLALQRMLSGAVELFNLDENRNVETIPWQALVDHGYLVEIPVDPGGPIGSHTRFSLDLDAPHGIRCSRHGVEGEPPPRLPVRRLRVRPVPNGYGLLGLGLW